MQFYRYSYSVQSTTTEIGVEATNEHVLLAIFLTNAHAHRWRSERGTWPLGVRLLWPSSNIKLQVVILNSAVRYWIFKVWTARGLTPIDQSASRIADQVIMPDTATPVHTLHTSMRVKDVAMLINISYTQRELFLCKWDYIKEKQTTKIISRFLSRKRNIASQNLSVSVFEQIRCL